jgi:uncharacterized membrane protein YgdD (TMEM256/DUF423 family)
MYRAVKLPKTILRASAMLPMMLIAVIITRALADVLPSSTTRWSAVAAALGVGLFSVMLFSTLLIATRILPWAMLRRAGEVFRAFVAARLGARYAI